MLTTRNITNDVRDVPSRWIFEYYYSLPKPLDGQRVQVKSMFNPAERTPSMYFYFEDKYNDYRFKCFSTNNQGDGVSLLMGVEHLTFSQAITKVLNDYNVYVIQHGTKTIKREYTEQQTKLEVDNVETRGWAKIDEQYWLDLFKISSTTLKRFNVKPLDSITLVSETPSGTKSSTIHHSHMYGYFNDDDELYKVYQPSSKKYKFMKLQDYLQGLHQLTYEKPYLVICSSLKDCMALHELGYNNIETIAPDSENTMIKPMYIETFLKRYEGVVTLFDSDAAGKAAGNKYYEEYGIKPTILHMMKDLSDSVAIYGTEEVKRNLTPLLRKALSLNS